MTSSTANMARMERTTELRHVSNKYLGQLSNILNTLDSWKELMAAIPKRQISATEFDESTTQTKYKHSEIKDIEVASRATRQPTLILFNEWGTSGHVRPTLAHLMILLVRLELYRAADFVATEMLKEPAPVRPVVGPAARVDLTFLERSNQTTITPTIGPNTIENQIQPDKIGPSVVQKVVPEPIAVASEVPHFTSNRNLDGPFIKTEPPADIVDISTSMAIPHLSALMGNTPTMSGLNIPRHIGLSVPKSIDNIPNIPDLLASSATQSEMNIPQNIGLSRPDTAEPTNEIVPNLPALLGSNSSASDANIPRNIGLSGESEPHGSLLPAMLNAISLQQPVTADQTDNQSMPTTSNIPRGIGLSGHSVQSNAVNSITDAPPTSTRSNIPLNISGASDKQSEAKNESDDENIPLVSALG